MVPNPANDPDIAIFESFADTYMSGMTDQGEDLGIYYISKDFTSRRIAPTSAGGFSPDGDYYYFIHENNGSSILKKIDLKSENFTSIKVFEGAVNLCVTKKNNVYFVDDNGSMRFLDTSKDTSTKRGLGEDIGEIGFYHYGNTIYYAIEDAEGNAVVYCSEEGSARELVEMDSIKLNGIPQFTNPNSKKTYAAYYDESEGCWMLFYTANGRSFKMISNVAQLDELFGTNSVG